MTDKSIIFSGPMVRALLDGRKTQTRRVLKLADDLTDKTFTGQLVNYYGDRRLGMKFQGTTRVQPLRYARGDRLWVREAHAFVPASAYRCSIGVEQAVDPGDPDRAALYREGWERSRPGKWRPSIHMPRWASRLTLTVTDVRVQRLHEISEEDAMAEGIYRTDPTPEDIAKGCTPQDFVFQAPGVRQSWGPKSQRDNDQWWPNAPGAFRLLWNSIHGPDAWEANPWCAAISFRVHHCNIDAVAP